MVIQCRTNQTAVNEAQEGRKKKGWSSAERSSLRKQAEQRNKLLNQAKETYGEVEADNAAQAAAQIEGTLHEFQTLVGEVITLNPSEGVRLQDALARNFGIMKKGLGLGDDFTVAGKIRKDLMDTKRTAQGMVDVAGKWLVIGRTRKMEQEFGAIAKKYGFNKDQTDELFLGTLEVGQNVRSRAAYGNTDAVNTFLDDRYSEWMSSMKTSGFDESEINKLVELSMTVSNAADEVRAIAQALGVDIGHLENIGYMTRVFQDDAALRLDVLLDRPSNLVQKVGIGLSSYAKSRDTWRFIPEDLHLLSEMLTPGATSKWNEWLRKATGLQQSGLDNLGNVLSKEVKQGKVNDEVARVVGKSSDEVTTIRRGILDDRELKRTQRDQLRERLAADKGMKVDEYIDWAKSIREKAKVNNVKPSVELAKFHGMTLDEFKTYHRGISTEIRRTLVDDAMANAVGMTHEGYKALTKKVKESIDKVVATPEDIMDEIAVLTNKTVPELEAIRDDLVRGTGGLTANDLQDLFQKPLEWLDHLHKNLSGEQIDALVDSGIMSKVPMTTREVFDYFVKQYDLPYTKMSELFVTNPVQALEKYKNSLRRAAGDSAMFRRIINDGSRANWIVPRAMSDDPQFAGFKNLQDIDIARFGISEQDAETFKGAFVHPRVYEQLSGLVELQTQPKTMHEFAQSLAWLQRQLNGGALLGSNVAWVAKTFFGNTIQYVAGGGNMARMIPAHIDMMKLMKNGLEAFDDVHPFLKDGDVFITKREAIKRFTIGRGHDFIPMTAGQRISDVASGYQAVNPLNIPKALHNIYSYGQLFGSPLDGIKGSVTYTAKMFEDMQSTLLHPFAVTTNYLDISTKWGLLTSTMKIADVSDGIREAQQLLGGKHFNATMDEAFQHLDNYMVDYASLGAGQQWFGKYVRPFAGYALMNPPMQIRHAMRNPTKFMAYMRLYSFLNSMNDKPDVTEAGFSKYELNDLPMSLHYDPATKQATTMFPSNFDPIVDALVFGKDTATKVQRMFGKNVGNGYERRSDLLTPYTVRQFLEDTVAKNANSLVKVLAEVSSGKDSFTGMDIDKTKADLFGVPVSSDVAWLMGKFPLIGALDRKLGGRGVITDTAGNVVSPAERGLLGTPDRPASRSEKTQFYTEKELGTFRARVIATAGIKVKTIDVAENNQFTLADISKTGTALSSAIKQKEMILREKPDTKGLAELETMRAQYLQLVVDAYRVKQWMEKNNVPSKDALNKLRENGIAVRTLPIPSAVIDGFVDDITGVPKR